MHKIKTLKNGLRLITVPRRGTRTATVLVMVGTGSKYENKANNGIAHFLEHMFFKGTKKRPNTLRLSSEIDGLGAEYNAFTGKEYTGYWIKADAAKIGPAMDALSDMLLHSKFAAREIEREKRVIIEEINMYYDNPLFYIEDLFETCLYGNQPAGWDTLGTKENVLRFKRRDFIDYWRSQYSARNTFVCLAGQIRPETIKMVERYFGGLRTVKSQDKLLVKEKQVGPRVKLHYKKTDQAHLSLGVRAFPLGHQDEFILKVMAILLGGTMSSRLFIALRERHGLAYCVRSQAEFYTDSGYLTTQASVPLGKIEQAIGIILSEYRKLSSDLVKKPELDKIKQCLKGRMTLQLEASDNAASWYARSAVLRGRILTPEDFFQAINQVAPQDIRRVAGRIFVNQGLNLAVIGPFKNEKKLQGLLMSAKSG